MEFFFNFRHINVTIGGKCASDDRLKSICPAGVECIDVFEQYPFYIAIENTVILLIPEDMRFLAQKLRCPVSTRNIFVKYAFKEYCNFRRLLLWKFYQFFIVTRFLKLNIQCRFRSNKSLKL